VSMFWPVANTFLLFSVITLIVFIFFVLVSLASAFERINRARAAIICRDPSQRYPAIGDLFAEILFFQNHPLVRRYARKTLAELDRYLPEHMK